MKLFVWLTGIHRSEARQTVLSFLAVFFLLLSYYLIKPLRNSQFLNSFSPDLLPWFYLFTPILSLIVTKTFNFFCGRLPKYRLIIVTYALMMICKLFFLWYLPSGGKIAMISFYFWASVYFLLAVSILWGCISTIFSAAQGERLFGLIALGGTLGNICGAEASGWIARSSFKDLALPIAALAMGMALGFLLLALHRQEHMLTPAPPDHTERAHAISSRGWEDVKELWRNRYIRGIAVMVFVLALFNTVMDFQSQQLIDFNYSRQTYQHHFHWLKTPPAEGLQFLQNLRTLPEQQQTTVIDQFLAVPAEQARFKSAWQAYQQEKEANIRAFFSRIYKYQGILGIVLLLGGSRLLFKRAGLKISSLILPVFLLLSGIALYFPLELLTLEIILTIGGALNYSLNNASKELLYTITSEDARFKLKPLIEGPLMRLGDVSASFLKLGSSLVTPLLLKSTSVHGDRLMLALSLVMVIFWMYAIAMTGRHYDHLNLKRAKPS
jgi:ATP/ADP translocase